MILKHEKQFDKREFIHLDKPEFRDYLSRNTGAAFGEEIMKFTELKEVPEDNQNIVRLRAEVRVIPQSQYEYVIGLLKTLNGISPAINDIVRQIVQEL